MADTTDSGDRPNITSFRADLFAGQAVLVTGAGTGIGRATAERYAALGARVLLCGRREDRLAETKASIEAAGGTAHAFPMSIRDPAQVAAAIDDAWLRWGRLDVVVNNAGGQFPQAAIDYTPKGWLAVIDTNLNGTWWMMQTAAQRWRDRKFAGAIVNIVLDVWRGIPGMAHSTAARAGIIYLSKTVAVEWAPLDIRVNCVAPGLIETEGFQHYDPVAREKFRRDSNPQRRTGNAADIADACVYLTGPSAKFITGEVLTVDGGQQLWGDVWATPKPRFFDWTDK
ncbi:MAG: SDR family oxidoreductase [Alphaproteobacteria bacterium]